MLSSDSKKNENLEEDPGSTRYGLVLANSMTGSHTLQKMGTKES
jgi:hypothetical protein